MEIETGTQFKVPFSDLWTPWYSKAFLECGLGPFVPACWYCPWKWPFPSCQLPWHWSIVCTQLLLGMEIVFHTRAHSQAQAIQLRCETLDLAAGTWQPDMVSYPQLSSAISKHSLVCHETTLNFSEHELFHLTWLEREWAGLGVLLTIICFSLDQTFSHAPIFGPALPGGVGTKAGPVASRARSRPQIWDLCQTEGKRTADCHWECKRTEDQMGEGICPASYAKMVANWDTAPRPSLPCLWAVRCLLLPLPQATGPPYLPFMSVVQALEGLLGLSCLRVVTQLNWFLPRRQLTSKRLSFTLFYSSLLSWAPNTVPCI